MKLHDLHPAKGSRRERKRVGRGIAAGQGKTAGRGQKGQFSRSSPGLPRGFEGGQMPLAQRLPKLRGFHNRWKKEYATVNISKLNRFEAGSVVDADALLAAGLVGRARDGVKLLSAGRLRVALTVRVHRASAAARKAVESAGGRLELVGPGDAAEVSKGAVAAAARAARGAAEQPPAQAADGATEPVTDDASDAADAAADDEGPAPA